VRRVRLTLGLNGHVFVVHVKLPAVQHVVSSSTLHGHHLLWLEADLLQSCLYPLFTIAPPPPQPHNPPPLSSSLPTKVKASIVTPTWSWWFVARPLRALASGYSVRVLADRFSCWLRSRAVKVVVGLTCASRRHLWHQNCGSCVWPLVTETQIIQKYHVGFGKLLLLL